MIVKQKQLTKRLIFESHARSLERSLFPGQKARVQRYTERYLAGEDTSRRHPILTFRHRLLEETVRPRSEEGIRCLKKLRKIEKDSAVATANWNRAWSVAYSKTNAILNGAVIAAIGAGISLLDTSRLLAYVAGIAILAAGYLAADRIIIKPYERRWQSQHLAEC